MGQIGWAVGARGRDTGPGKTVGGATGGRSWGGESGGAPGQSRPSGGRGCADPMSEVGAADCQDPRLCFGSGRDNPLGEAPNRVRELKTRVHGYKGSLGVRVYTPVW